MKIEIFQPLSINELGKRENQEDALWRKDATTEDRLFIVCDGMGGHEKGEVASQTFSESLGKWFDENVIPSTVLTDEQLQAAIEYAYEELDKKDDVDSPKKMGTTLTLLYIHARGITAAHIGDSRIYHFRPSEGILYQSRDHSLVFELYQSGEISFEEMATHPQKNVITKAVTPGEDNRTRPDIIHITDIQPGDYFYMCSDGMLEQMDNDALMNLFASTDSDEKKRLQLIAATADNADNHTAWLIHVKSVTREVDDTSDMENEEKTARCNAINVRKKIHHTEVHVAEADDVVVVANPTKRHRQENAMPENMNSQKPYKKRKRRMLWFFLSFVLVLAIAVVTYISVFEKKSEIKKEQTTEVDSTKSIREEAASPNTVTGIVDAPPTTTPKKQTPKDQGKGRKGGENPQQKTTSKPETQKNKTSKEVKESDKTKGDGNTTIETNGIDNAMNAFLKNNSKKNQQNNQPKEEGKQ